VLFIRNFVFQSVGTQHVLHLAFPPEDLYKPVASDNFLFYEKGFTKEYALEPQYIDLYSIGFFVEKNNLPSTYKFKGKVKAEFFYKNKLLFRKEIISINSAGYADKESKYFKDVDLLSFDIPFQGKYKDDISIRLTVLEPDESLKEYGDAIKLFIRVSPIP